MIQGFFLISCVLTVTLFIGIFWIRKFNNRLRKLIQIIFAIAMLAVFSNAVGLLVDIKWLSDFSFGIYIASIDWIIFVMMIFMQEYTDVYEEISIVKNLTLLFCLMDTLSMIVNTWTHHAFTTKKVDILKNESCNVIVGDGILYDAHLYFLYTMIVMIALSLTVKTHRTLKLYRKKYEVILFSFLIIVGAAMAYRLLHSPIDISPILYIILAVSLAYFALIYVPKGLVAKLLSFSIHDMDSSIICYDKDGKCVYANKVAFEVLKTDTLEGFETFLQKWLNGRDIEKIDAHSWFDESKTDNATSYYEAQYRPLTDEKNNFLGCYLAIIDKTKDIESMEKERYRATHDELTGAYNRTRFFEKVREELKKNPDVERYIIVSDIKDFKLVNDLFGEKRGDEILIKTSQMLKKLAKSDSVYGRLSSDRFVLLIRKEYYNEDAFKNFIKTVEDMAKNSVFRMHIHIGVYQITDLSLEVSVMCDRALLAIQRIKDSYQQTVSYYDDTIGDKIHQQNIMLSEFSKAIKEEQFKMFLQPQVSSDDMRLLGAEALVRWEHPERGMISPGDFIPLFERTGHIYKLDMFIWKCACKKLKEWKDMGKENLHISVNISQKDFYYIDIYKTFTELVEEYQIKPENLKLEITETAIMDNLSKYLPLLERLKKYGFHIEIDDFGSGYSSLNTLKDMNVDVLKLDMGFLSETEHSEKSRIIMNSIIDMAKKLGMLTIAEGVEELEQVEYLKKAGCNIFQGYYFSKPLAVNEFEKKYFAES